MHSNAIAVVVDPRPEPRPRFDQRFVRHLDALGASRQEPRFDEQIDHLTIDRRSDELFVEHLAPGVLATLTGFDEAHEQPLGLNSLWLLETVIDPIGGSSDRGDDRTCFAIGVKSQRLVGAPLPRLDQCVRNKRKRASMVGGLGHDGVDKILGDNETNPFRWLGDGGS